VGFPRQWRQTNVYTTPPLQFWKFLVSVGFARLCRETDAPTAQPSDKVCQSCLSASAFPKNVLFWNSGFARGSAAQMPSDYCVFLLFSIVRTPFFCFSPTGFQVSGFGFRTQRLNQNFVVFVAF
jgi:hypothetical protein